MLILFVYINKKELYSSFYGNYIVPIIKVLFLKLNKDWFGVSSDFDSG